MSAAPVEGKVWAATVGAGGGYVVAKAVLWLLGVTVWGVPFDAAHAIAAVEAVPAPVSSLLTWALGAGAAFFAGYRAKHTPRPIDAAPELVAGPDLSVVAATLAELRALIPKPASAGPLDASEADRPWTDSSPRSGVSNASATSSPSDSNAGSLAAATSSTAPGADASAAGSDARTDSIEGQSMVEDQRQLPSQQVSLGLDPGQPWALQ